MLAPTTSNQWYRVADLHPRLRGHVRVQRQRYRDETSYLLADGLRGRIHRLNAQAYAFIGRCNGQRSVQAVWDSLLETDPEHVPTQDEVIALLIQLNQRGLLQCEQTPDVEQLFRDDFRERRQNRMQAMNPLAFRVALMNPAAILKRFDALGPLIFNTRMLVVWLVLMGFALLTTATHWDALKAHADLWLLTPQGIFLSWLAYPLVKAVHEFAHGLAIRRWGGEVHKAGITLMVLTPIPFVDASAASEFREAHRRFTVSAAGIMAELTLAALAVLLWTQIQPGLVRDLALIVATIGGVSTLFFNGNPLLRFDGYYMLSDAIQVPNLYARSGLYWRYLLLRYCLRLDDAQAPQCADGERAWLIAYGPLSWLYRAALTLIIVTWVGAWSPVLATIVGLYSLWALFGTPVKNLWHSLRRTQSPLTAKRRAKAALAAWALGLFILLGAVPMPFATVTQGVVWIPENAQVRAESGGFITAFAARDGDIVAAGDRLVVLSDPELLVEAARLRSEVLQLETEQFRLMLSDPVAAANRGEHLRRLASDLAEVEERIAQLEIRAGVSGRLSIPHQADIEGTYLPKGRVMGHIVNSEPAIVRVAVGQNAAALVSADTRSISVRLAEARGQALDATLKSSLAGSSERLPSAALADRSNGPHVVDPGDPEYLKTREPVFVFDLALPIAQGERIGGRAWVRFEHAAAPLAVQWGRRLQQLFLHSFNPGG